MERTPFLHDCLFYGTVTTQVQNRASAKIFTAGRHRPNQCMGQQKKDLPPAETPQGDVGWPIGFPQHHVSHSNPSSAASSDNESEPGEVCVLIPKNEKSNSSRSPSPSGDAVPSPTRRGSIMKNVAALTQPAEMKRVAESAWTKLTHSFVATQTSMKKSPFLLSIVIGVSSLGVLWSGIFDAFSLLIRVHPVSVVVRLYQIMFALLCLTTEITRHAPLLGVRSFLHKWLPFLELAIGRGLFQILTAGLGIVFDNFDVRSIPAIVLALCGGFNLYWGISCSRKLNEIFRKLSEESNDVNESKDLLDAIVGAKQRAPTASTLSLIHQKFALLDANHDGKLSRDEMKAGCQSLNIILDEAEIEMIFHLLDPKGKGHIDVTDFEEWWLQQKGHLLFS